MLTFLQEYYQDYKYDVTTDESLVPVLVRVCGINRINSIFNRGRADQLH